MGLNAFWSARNLPGVLGAFGALELAGLKKSDQFSSFSNHCHGPDTVTLHQLLCVAEGSVWFDEEPRRNRPHHVAGAREMPALARQSLQIFERQHAVQSLILRDRKGDLPVQRENGVDQVTDEHVRLD